MRLLSMSIVGVLVAALGLAAQAELQSVQVGGSIRIRGNWYDAEDNDLIDTAFVEQRTRLNVKADFTDNVTAFIEIDSYDIWGEDFRAPNYVTGVDARAVSDDDVEIYQAYVEATDMWGTGLELKVGRQEISLGSEWLMGVNDASSIFTGLSFDAVKIGYEMEDYFRVHAFWAKLAESFGDMAHSDVDLYGIYATLTMVENVEFDAYWLYLRDDVNYPLKATNLHTIGLRAGGEVSGFDFEVEGAFQFGDDKSAYSTNFGANIELGYTVDLDPMSLRPFAGFACFINCGKDFLGRPDVPFNRLFSNWEYSEFLENTDLSNAYIYRAGLGFSPHESIDLQLVGACFQADRFTPAKRTREAAWELGLYGEYRYTEDLAFRAGFAKLWVDDGINKGDFISLNGLAPFDPQGNEHLYYTYLETEIKF